MIQWLSYSPLDPRFAGSIPAGVDGFFSERKNPEYDFLRKGGKAVCPVSQTFDQNLSDFSRSMSEATLMTFDIKKCLKTKNNHSVGNPNTNSLFIKLVRKDRIATTINHQKYT